MRRLLYVVSKRTGKQFDIELIRSWSLAGFLPFNERQVQKLFGYIWNNSNWRHIRPIERGMNTRIDELSAMGNVSIVTSAGVDQVPGKMKWLKFHGIEKPLTVVPFGWTKEMLGYPVYIDDRPETIERVVALGRVGILYDQPWNRTCKSGIRVHSLAEAVDILKNVRVEHEMIVKIKK